MTTNLTKAVKTDVVTEVAAPERRDNVIQGQFAPAPETAPTTQAVITVNIGAPGNIKRVALTGDRDWTVSDAMEAAGLKAKGYEIRVGGEPVTPNTTITDGQTILFLKPVRGNLDLTKPENEGSGVITVNIGAPGNIKKVALPAGRQWTVGDALESAGLNASGYEIRVGGEPVNAGSPVVDGQTVLLLKPVRGNVDLTKPGDGAEADVITLNVGAPGNIKKVALPGGRDWTVADALNSAGLNGSGYEIRVSGEPVTNETRVANGQTVLLLKPVRGN